MSFFLPYFPQQAQKRLWVRAIVEALEKAGTDPKVKGLIVRLGNGTSASMYRLGHIEELREAIAKFKKPKLAHAESIGAFTNALRAYYLMTAFDRICVSPIGSVHVPGMLMMQPFLKQTLEKLGVEPIFLQRNQYKTFANMFTQTEFTEAHQEQMESLMNDAMKQIVSDIAQSRKVSEEVVRNQWFEKGIYTSQEALQDNLIDKLCYRFEAKEEIAHMIGMKSKSEAHFHYLHHYFGSNFWFGWTGVKSKIAILYCTGKIVDGDASDSSIFTDNEQVIYSYNTARAIRKLAKDPRIQAIILRVDSGGGSAIGSDLIAKEVQRAKAKGKRIVVSMVNTAGSGAYWISMYADKIVCNNLCITGSIGGILGKFNIRGLIDRIGVTVDHIQSNGKATMFSPMFGYTPDQLKLANHMLDDMYEQFVDNVSKARQIPKEKVYELANGQVYMGKRAKELKLVDEIGGLSRAVEVTRELLQLPPEHKLHLEVHSATPKQTMWNLFKTPPKSSETLMRAILWLFVSRDPVLEAAIKEALEVEGIQCVQPYCKEGI